MQFPCCFLFFPHSEIRKLLASDTIISHATKVTTLTVHACKKPNLYVGSVPIREAALVDACMDKCSDVFTSTASFPIGPSETTMSWPNWRPQKIPDQFLD